MLSLKDSFSLSGLFNIPKPHMTSQKKNSTIRSISNQPSRQSPAACPERPYSSITFTNLSNSLNSEPKELIRIDISSSIIGNINQNFAANNGLNHTESVLILQQIKQNQHSEKSLQKQPQKKSSIIRSITDQTKRPNSSSAFREAETEQNIH